MMRIIPLDKKHIPQARQWINRLIEGEGLVYKPLEEDAFEGVFWRSLPQARRHTALLETEEGRIAGLASGVSMPLAGKAYISFIAVAAPLRRQGWGTRLLAWLEEQLTSQPEGRPERLEIVFFNPASLTWMIPGTAGHDHPNAPGVDVASDAYIFFKNRGYRDFAMQNAYYLPLAQYEYPEALAQRLAALSQRGIEITYYDPKAHQGLAGLMDALGNEDWRQRVLENVHRPDGGDPLLVVVHQGRVAGFTGPLSVQPSGRGYFAGIGIHPDYRGLGAGKALFAALCRGLKQQGAGYMTLFTGENNPARNIYVAAGFKIVRVWADMRKEG